MLANVANLVLFEIQVEIVFRAEPGETRKGYDVARLQDLDLQFHGLQNVPLVIESPLNGIMVIDPLGVGKLHGEHIHLAYQFLDGVQLSGGTTIVQI